MKCGCRVRHNAHFTVFTLEIPKITLSATIATNRFQQSESSEACGWEWMGNELAMPDGYKITTFENTGGNNLEYWVPINIVGSIYRSVQFFCLRYYVFAWCDLRISVAKRPECRCWNDGNKSIRNLPLPEFRHFWLWKMQGLKAERFYW